MLIYIIINSHKYYTWQFLYFSQSWAEAASCYTFSNVGLKVSSAEESKGRGELSRE